MSHTHVYQLFPHFMSALPRISSTLIIRYSRSRPNLHKTSIKYRAKGTTNKRIAAVARTPCLPPSIILSLSLSVHRLLLINGLCLCAKTFTIYAHRHVHSYIFVFAYIAHIFMSRFAYIFIALNCGICWDKHCRFELLNSF